MTPKTMKILKKRLQGAVRHAGACKLDSYMDRRDLWLILCHRQQGNLVSTHTNTQTDARTHTHTHTSEQRFFNFYLSLLQERYRSQRSTPVYHLERLSHTSRRRPWRKVSKTHTHTHTWNLILSWRKNVWITWTKKYIINFYFQERNRQHVSREEEGKLEGHPG